MPIFSDNGKVDYITIDGNIYTHKQIENRNGLIFMRMKKRFLPDFKLNEGKSTI